MSEKKIKTIQRIGFVSEIDQFLRDYDNSHHAMGVSKQKEIKKHQRIFAKRDAVVEDETPVIWEKF